MMGVVSWTVLGLISVIKNNRGNVNIARQREAIKSEIQVPTVLILANKMKSLTKASFQ